MLQKAKQLCSKVIDTAATQVKKNLPILLSLVLTVTAVLLTVFCSARTVTVYDGANHYTTSGSALNLNAALAKISLPKAKYDIVSVETNAFSTNVEINYHIALTVKTGDKSEVYNVKQGKLSDAFEAVGIETDEHDIISLPLNTYLDKDATVEITDIEYETVTKTESIPFGSDTVYSSKYDTNTSVVEPGKAGSKTLTYSVKYVNGVAVSTTLVDETITEYAIDKTTIIGTSAPQYAGSHATKADDVPSISKLDAPDDLLLDKDGKPIKYTGKKTLRATAYTHTGNKMSTGKYPKPGYVAVDPKEIPYGTKMYIVSADGKYVYGYAIAADTGGFIHGTRTDMDLFFNTEKECVKFGRRNIVVYFVD